MKPRYWIGILLIVIGLWIWFDYLGVPYIAFSKNWPLLLVTFGLYLIIRRLKRPSRFVKKSQVINDLAQGKISVDEAIEQLKGKG